VTELDFEQIYTEYRHKIIRYVRRFVGDEGAEDVTQAVLIKLNQSMANFEGRSSMDTWVYKIAMNTALDYLRGKTAVEKKRVTLAHTPSAAGYQRLIEDDRASPEEVLELGRQNA
jgi:RNA polymerase sigma factor (sigma-70 family)